MAEIFNKYKKTHGSKPKDFRLKRRKFEFFKTLAENQKSGKNLAGINKICKLKDPKFMLKNPARLLEKKLIHAL